MNEVRCTCTLWAKLPAADHISHRYSGLEVSAWPRSDLGLTARCLLSHPGHQRSKFPPLNGTGSSRCPLCPYFHKAVPCILGGWPFRQVPCGMDFRWRSDCSPGFTLMHSTIASKLFFIAVQGSGVLLSSSVEEALYEFP